jgi:hypothetical protein
MRIHSPFREVSAPQQAERGVARAEPDLDIRKNGMARQ